MNITIHRGADEIGGSCVEVRSGDRRIILDLGMPLLESERPLLPEVKGLYRGDVPTTISSPLGGEDQGEGGISYPSMVDAVILSHPHLDHYGLMDWVHPDIPVYMSGESETLLEVGGIFFPPEMQQTEVLTHCKTFKHWKPFGVGPFRITSYLMDHSAFGSSSLVIEADGKRLFYTGDFRGHGRKSKLFEDMIKDPVENIDCLILEGTTITQPNKAAGSTLQVASNRRKDFGSEEEVEHAMAEIFGKQEDVSFVISAGSNIDRLVSIYKAALRTGKTMVVDLYQLYMLNQLKEYAPGLPPHDTETLRVLYIKGHTDRLVDKIGKEILYQYKKWKINQDEIIANREKMVLRLPLWRIDKLCKVMVKDKPLTNANFIYSMWSGYRSRDRSFNDFADLHALNDYTIHTSGHAYLDASKRLVEALKPKAVIPIHTQAGDAFSEHFENVVRLQDGDGFEV